MPIRGEVTLSGFPADRCFSGATSPYLNGGNFGGAVDDSHGSDMRYLLPLASYTSIVRDFFVNESGQLICEVTDCFATEASRSRPGWKWSIGNALPPWASDGWSPERPWATDEWSPERSWASDEWSPERPQASDEWSPERPWASDEWRR